MKIASTISGDLAAALVALPLLIPCQQRADMLAALERDFGEVPVALGLAATGAIIEVFAAPDGATWTLVITDANQTSCVVGYGDHWRAVRVDKGKPA